MRKLTVLGASALLIAGLVAPPAAAFAAPVQAGSGLTVPTDEAAAPVDGDVTPAPAPDEGSGVLAATGTSTAIGFALIAFALVGGGVTLIVLRRKGALGD